MATIPFFFIESSLGIFLTTLEKIANMYILNQRSASMDFSYYPVDPSDYHTPGDIAIDHVAGVFIRYYGLPGCVKQQIIKVDDPYSYFDDLLAKISLDFADKPLQADDLKGAKMY